ncbi:DUF4197 domain-containing protein [Persicobacter psychrovividus]|uniref:DUF4197 domain-containing protein n=1 Tax=Persicobacter psychrovividus TaxID=387638 RepID=A0ABM7VL16_9BACT|nr:hypothetical protein PEPS_39370 [Persicobacter psychrovividus]
MKNRIAFLSLALAFIISSCSVVQSLSSGEVDKALSQMLDLGTEHAVAALGVKNGYLLDEDAKIPLPAEARAVLENDAVKAVIGKYVDDIETGINRSAEAATDKAEALFKKAIREMSYQDAYAILLGSNGNEATEYLKRQAYDELKSEYHAPINEQLDKAILAGKSTNELYTLFASTYNAIPFIGGKLEADNLPDYVTEKALDGLFVKIEQREKKIRANPTKYGSDLLTQLLSTSK